MFSRAGGPLFGHHGCSGAKVGFLYAIRQYQFHHKHAVPLLCRGAPRPFRTWLRVPETPSIFNPGRPALRCVWEHQAARRSMLEKVIGTTADLGAAAVGSMVMYCTITHTVSHVMAWHSSRCVEALKFGGFDFGSSSHWPTWADSLIDSSTSSRLTLLERVIQACLLLKIAVGIGLYRLSPLLIPEKAVLVRHAPLQSPLQSFLVAGIGFVTVLAASCMLACAAYSINGVPPTADIQSHRIHMQATREPNFQFTTNMDNIVCAPLLEETIFRGLVLIKLCCRLGAAPAVALTSLCFGSMHFDAAHPNYLQVAAATVGGLVYGLSFLLTGRLSVPIATHVAQNAFACFMGSD